MIKYLKMNWHLLQHFEICIPTPFNSTAFVLNNNYMSMNVIGYVGRAPSLFDLIADPWIDLQVSLKTISDVNGKTPA